MKTDQSFKNELNANFNKLIKSIKQVCPEYVVDNYNKNGLMAMTVWASRISYNGFENIDFNKGLFIYGEKGTGKSKAMEGLRNALKGTKNRFKLSKAEDISDTAAQGEDLSFYIEKTYNYSRSPYNLCIDDLGFERTIVKYFGNEICPCAYVLAKRYDMFEKHNEITHITTNLSGDQIEAIYGDRIRDRLRRMFNVITFYGPSRR